MLMEGTLVEGVFVGFWLVVPKSTSFKFLFPFWKRSFEGLGVDGVLVGFWLRLSTISRSFVFESNKFV